MKNFKRKLSMVLVLTLLAGLFMPMDRVAAMSTKTLTATKTAKTQRAASDTWYKIKVPGEGYLTFSVPSNYYKYTSFIICDENQEYVATVDYDKTAKLAVSKGYVYVKSTYVSKYNTEGFTYKFASIKDPKNYSKSKAYTLAANKNVSFYQTPDNHYGRWIKINTKKKQNINIYVRNLYSVRLYSKNGKSNNLTASSKKDKKGYYEHSSTMLPKGTYYIYLQAWAFSDQYDVIDIKWK